MAWKDRKAHNEYHRKLARSHRKRKPELYRNTRYKYFYGITLEDFQNQLSQQDGCCSICSKVLDGVTYSAKPQLDHDHTNGMIRDILCRRCNVVLGSVKDDTEFLSKFISYLQRHKEQPSNKVAKNWHLLDPRPLINHVV